MTAGQELDELIAEKVMGWKKIDRKAIGWADGPLVWDTGESSEQENSSPTRQWFNPSTSIADAWRVVEKIIARGREGTLCHPGLRDPVVKVGMSEADIFCEIFESSTGYVGVPVFRESIVIYSSSAPHAVCIAALKAVGVEVSQ